MSEIIPNSTNFPQFSQGETTFQRKSTSQIELADFRFQPAVQNRPVQISAVEQEEYGIVLTFNTNARHAILSYTHETAVHLYNSVPKTIDTLYLHIHLWSEEIFRVVFSKEKHIINHFAGLPEDAQMLIRKPQKVDFVLQETERDITLTTSKIQIRIDKKTTKISAHFIQGTEFFSQMKYEFQTGDVHDLALADLDDAYACFEALDLEQDEIIYGLGERFDSLTRNGRTVDFHNKDAIGTTSRRSYINVPFYLSTKGYGLFLNSSTKIDWQIGTTDFSALQFAVLDSQLDYFVIAGQTPKDIIKGYCTLTGFSQLPPLWSFGLWMSRNSYVS